MDKEKAEKIIRIFENGYGKYVISESNYLKAKEYLSGEENG